MPSAGFAFLWTFQGKRSTGAHTEKAQKPVLQNSSNTFGPRRNKCKCSGTHFSIYFNLVFPLNNISSPLGRFMEGLNITKEKYYTKMHVLSSPSESLRWGKSDWMFNIFCLPRLTDTWDTYMGTDTCKNENRRRWIIIRPFFKISISRCNVTIVWMFS